jgi:hypothetical protein
MRIAQLMTAIAFMPLLAVAQTSPSMLGTWKGISNSAVYGGGLFHPTEASKEKSIRFRNVEYILTIDREEGRNFAGIIGAANTKHPTDVKYKEIVLGAYSKDMKSGVMVNEAGTFSFKLTSSKELEVCFTQVAHLSVTAPIVASCFEMTKQ